MTTYYVEYTNGRRVYPADSDEEAVQKAQQCQSQTSGDCLVVYKESDTADGTPFIILYEDVVECPQLASVVECPQLASLASQYEANILKLINIEKFYQIDWEDYFAIRDRIIDGLTFVGSGCCCYVYTDGSGYVLKLHHPCDAKYSFRCDPKPNSGAIGVAYYLFPIYYTKKGLAAVQLMVDCSPEAQKEAYRKFGKIDEVLTRCNHIKNMGLLDNKPVYVDWH